MSATHSIREDYHSPVGFLGFRPNSRTTRPNTQGADVTARFIVIAAQAEAASQVSDDFAKLVPSSTLARVSAGGT